MTNKKKKLPQGSTNSKRPRSKNTRRPGYNPRAFEKRGKVIKQGMSPYMSLFYEAVRLSTSNAAVIGNAVSDIQDNIAFISDSLIEPALLRHYQAVPGADVFRSTEMDSYADYATYMAEVLVELRAQKFVMDVFPGLSRDDAAAGSPWTRASWNGTVAWLIGQHVPYVSLNIAGMLSTPILIGSQNPTYGYPNSYFYPVTRRKTVATFESLLNLAAAEFDGLAGSNQLGQLGRPFSMMDVQYRAPHPLFSRMGHFMKYYYPVKDDASTAVHTRASTGDLIIDRRLGIGPEFDYGLYILALGTTAANDFLTQAAAGAGLLNFKHGTVGATSLLNVEDFAATKADYQKYVGWSANAAKITNGPFDTWDLMYDPEIVIKADFLASETAYENRLIRVIERDLKSEVFGGPGLIRHLTQETMFMGRASPQGNSSPGAPNVGGIVGATKGGPGTRNDARDTSTGYYGPE